MKEHRRTVAGTGYGGLSITILLSQAIIANRYDSCLNDVKGKVYTRDILEGTEYA